jgi:hypothetical protein
MYHRCLETYKVLLPRFVEKRRQVLGFLGTEIKTKEHVLLRL